MSKPSLWENLIAGVIYLALTALLMALDYWL